MKTTTWWILLFFLFSNVIYTYSQERKYHIQGTVTRSLNGEQAILTVKNEYQAIIHTETSILQKGQFSFEGNKNLNNLSVITIKDKDGVITGMPLDLLLEAGTLNVSFTSKQSRMKGTPLNEIFMIYQDSMRYLQNEIEKISPKWEGEMAIFPGSEQERRNNARGEYMMNFIKRNLSNPLGKAWLMRILDLYYIPTLDYMCSNAKHFDKIFAFIDDTTRNHPRFISFMEEIKKSIRPSLINKKIANFNCFSIDGKTIQLSDFIGKKDFTFIIFWVSWVERCLADIPQLKEIHKNFSNQLEIISISLENQQTSWINAVNTQNMSWPQFAAINGFDSDIAKTYNVQNLPYGLLVDKDGIIISQFSRPSILKMFMQDKSLHDSKFWLKKD